MTDDQYDLCCAKLQALTEEEREALDPISAALDEYMKHHMPRKGGRVIPNRIAALAAVDAATSWERYVWEME